MEEPKEDEVEEDDVVLFESDDGFCTEPPALGLL